MSTSMTDHSSPDLTEELLPIYPGPSSGYEHKKKNELSMARKSTRATELDYVITLKLITVG